MAKQLETTLAKLEQVSSEFKSGMVAHNTLEHSLEHNRAHLAILVWRRTQTPRAEKLLTKAKNLAYRIGVLSLTMEKRLFALDSIMYEGEDDEGRQAFRAARKQQVMVAQALISQLDQLRAKALRQERVFSVLLAKAARSSKRNDVTPEVSQGVRSNENSEVSKQASKVSNEISHETGSKVSEVDTDTQAELKAESEVQQRTVDEETSQQTMQTVTAANPEIAPEPMQITEEQNDETSNDKPESDSSDSSDSNESEGEELEQAEDIPIPKQEPPKHTSPLRSNVANPRTIGQSPVHRSKPQSHEPRGLDLLDLLGGYYPDMARPHRRQESHPRQESLRSRQAPPRYTRRGPPSATRRAASCYPQMRGDDYFYPNMGMYSRPCRTQDNPFLTPSFYPSFHPISLW